MATVAGDDSMIPTERVALIVYLLVRGETMTTREAARKVGLTVDGAALLLRKASRVIPLCEDGGRWELAEYDGGDGE